MIIKQNYNKQNKLERLGMSQMKGRTLFFLQRTVITDGQTEPAVHPEYPWALTFNYMGFSHVYFTFLFLLSYWVHRHIPITDLSKAVKREHYATL